MSQKINLGNYETRDYGLEIEVELSDTDTFTDVVERSKQLLAEDIGAYYSYVKNGLAEVSKPKGLDPAIEELLDRISNTKTSEDLRSLETTIKGLPESKDKDLVFKAFNRKMIKLSTV